MYTQLTISSKPQFSVTHKETKMPALKKRRSSTSDKPNDMPFGDSQKKTKIVETSEIHSKNNGSQVKDNSLLVENHIEKRIESKTEQLVTANGKNVS